MDAQAGRDERLEMADYVLDNGGDLAHLEGEVERLWAWLGAQATTRATPDRRRPVAATRSAVTGDR